MEWIRINTNKLKIMLTAEDARRYALRFEKVDYADTITRRAFKSILTDIKNEAGFDATEDKVYIQLYPSREGGCELFITKTGLLTSTDPAEHVHHLPYGDVGEEVLPPLQRSMAFSFCAMDKMLAACRRLLSHHFCGTSEAWRDDSGRFWIFLTEEGDPLRAQEDYMFIAEYGKIEHTEAAALLLSEHGTHICADHAIETLGTL